MYLLIGADVVPTESNMELFRHGEINQLIGAELLEIMNGASYRIFNLEVPITDTKNPIVKKGPNLIAPVSVAEGLKQLQVDLFTLANNHILDQGIQGLESTIKTLDSIGIKYVGVGEDLSNSSHPFSFQFGEKKIGIYACAEHEFSIASPDSPGANPFDALWSFDHVNDLKKKVDYVIVLYHGGKEHYRYPSPNLQKVCRRFVDKGADFVVCQHSHCIGCKEDYKNGHIVYGQGNFIFDYSDNECWQSGLLIKIDENFAISYIPIKKEGNIVRLADKESSVSILDGFNSRSKEIKSSETVERKYDEFSKVFLCNYLNILKGKETLFYKVANRLSRNRIRRNSLNRKYDENHFLSLENYIECEAHRELLLRGIKNKLKD